jgi:Replicative DNA helicase
VSLDLTLLSVMRERSKYNTLRHVIPEDMMSTTTAYMIKAFGTYFAGVADSDYVDMDALYTLVRIKTGSTPEQLVAFDALCTQLRNYKPTAAQKEAVVDQLTERDTSGKAGLLLQRYENGDDIDIIYELGRLSEHARRSRGQSSVTDYVDEDVMDIVKSTDSEHGVKFPLICLQDSVRVLLPGDSVAIAARPDSGKTSFIAYNLVRMAATCAKLYPGRPILWFNNEGQGRNIIPRLYQSALEVTLPELVEIGANRDELHRRYSEAMDAPANIIRVKDMHGATLAKAEQVIEAMKPCMVVWDMLANFKLAASDPTANKASQVEQLWQEVRELAVRHEFISFATVQVSADGADDMFPSLDALKDSKTGIQGATDVVLMLGSVDDPSLQARRGISTPKTSGRLQAVHLISALRYTSMLTAVSLRICK